MTEAEQTRLPESLFKYVKQKRIDILRDQEICFSPPSSFNDPFDLSPAILLPSDAEWSQFLERGEKDEGEKDFLRNIPKTHRQWFIEQAREKLTRRINAAFGVLSLTEHKNNLTMWAHYAEEHKGMVIEFDPSLLSPLAGTLPYEVTLETITHVTYSDDRPRVKLTEQVTNPAIFVTKSRDWEKEGEWRAIRKLSDLRKKPNDNGSGFAYMLKLSPKAIKNVVIGCRMGLKERQEVFEVVSSLKGVNIQVAMQDPERFVLNYVNWDDVPRSAVPPLDSILDAVYGDKPPVNFPA